MSNALLRELVDALPKCQQCGKRPATHGIHRSQPEACVEHVLPGVDTERCAWADAIEKAAVAIAAPTIHISDEELHVMRHAIGADKIDEKAKRCRKPQNRRAAIEAGYREPWRNCYTADAAGPSGAAWRRLVAIGLARNGYAGSELTGGDDVFYVSDAGRERLLDLAKARLLGDMK